MGGTCHLATEPFVALLEKIGPGSRDRVVSPRLFDDLALYEPLHVPSPQRLADPTVRASAAPPWRMTSELGSMTPYVIPQRWARWFRKAGFDGLWYRSRHDPEARSCVALFQKSGGLSGWEYPEPKPVTPLLREFERTVEISVERPPSAAQLRLEP